MNGILLVDKPADWTSNDVVQKLRGILHERRIGHAGTLDPMATGLLTVFVGRATRAVEFAESSRKRYLAGLRLGQETDTQDITGRVLRRAEDSVYYADADIEQCLKRFTGPQQQIPPMYSVVKINGQRLYKLARKGEEIARKPRAICIDSIHLLRNSETELLLDVTCSKGTYIRTLCADIGAALGCGGCMSSLRRLEAGPFRVDDAFTLEEIQEGEWGLLPVDKLFRDYPCLIIGRREEKQVKNGQSPYFPESEIPTDSPEPIRLYSEDGEFLAIASATDRKLRIIKSFYEV